MYSLVLNVNFTRTIWQMLLFLLRRVLSLIKTAEREEKKGLPPARQSRMKLVDGPFLVPLPVSESYWQLPSSDLLTVN